MLAVLAAGAIFNALATVLARLDVSMLVIPWNNLNEVYAIPITVGNAPKCSKE
ncbi:hypothetical protein D3C75_1279970 [compost metagenome]